jgi:hypothetical protein
MYFSLLQSEVIMTVNPSILLLLRTGVLSALTGWIYCIGFINGFYAAIFSLRIDSKHNEIGQHSRPTEKESERHFSIDWKVSPFSHPVSRVEAVPPMPLFSIFFTDT